MQAETGQHEPLINGPAPALWAGAGAFILIFIIGMMLIIRGRVTQTNATAARPQNRSFFEPAGEDAEITFGENAPSADDEARENTAQQRADNDGEPMTPLAHDNGSLHDDAPTADQESEASAEPKKKPAFAGLFGRKAKPEPAPVQQDADETAAFHDEEAAGMGFFAPEPEPLAPTHDTAQEAARIAQAEQAAREALKRAEDAEALARDLSRAQEEAQKVISVDLRKQEAALDQRVEAMAEMERRLAAMSEEFARRIDAISAEPAAVHSAPAGVSEEHFAEFANLMGEQFDALRGSVNGAFEKLSKRLDLLPLDASAGTATSARVQLSDLLGDALAPQRYKLGYKLPTGRTAEAAIIMPGARALIAIDARFPVESFDAWRLSRNAGAEIELRRAVLRNIADAGEKLIAPEETADCALMFIPSENILSELHAYFSDIVQESYRARVFMVSPTSLMATLHTIRAVMANAATKEPSAADFLDELRDLRMRIAALETSRQNGAAPAGGENRETATAAQPQTAQTEPAPGAALDKPSSDDLRETGESGAPFPLR